MGGVCASRTHAVFSFQVACSLSGYLKESSNAVKTNTVHFCATKNSQANLP